MAPVALQETPTSPPPATELNDESIVISGMSGLFPDCHNVKEFSELLYNKVNPVKKEGLRFNYQHPEVVQCTGSVPDLLNFDAQFFKVSYRLSMVMDPMSRKLLEQAYQAIYDAGINQEAFSNKKVGVFIGTSFSEADKSGIYNKDSRTGFGITGCNKSMFANRISYWLNAKGPSMSVDSSCCSSITALEQACIAMSRGECEAAIVGGAYLNLHPQAFVHYGRVIKLCPDGKTRSFDPNGEGCGKSESINVLFLQKAKDALRVYAEVIHAKTEYVGMMEDQTGPKYGYCREVPITSNFIKTFYDDANLTPQAVEYVEAFGCADPEADEVELKAIEEVFCMNKSEPLLVGSVMSNIGYTEAASGISSITKVLLGYHTGRLAANLHCSSLRQDIPALRDGRMRIVTEHERFRRSYVAVNGLSLTGINSHVLMNGHYKPKDITRYKSNIPYLIPLSGRHEAAVKYVIQELKANPIDPEQVALLHNIHCINIPGYLGRGYAILHTDENNNTKCISEQVKFFDDARRPLWFVYSGMGSQWAGMGAQLMRLPIFAAAIHRCHQVLEPKGIDIVDIITSGDDKMFDNILHSFVGIAAVQIGLTDILREVGLVPDGIIGHSVGELGCAYADGCLSAEEVVLAAYSRGLVSLQTPLIKGSMAAVGLGYKDIVEQCPPEIDVACRNGPESSTISGPADEMRQFVADLTARGIFAKEVPCSNIAYHSRYIAGAGPQLLKYLTNVIKSPKARSSRWVSTSVPQDRWEEPLAKLCSAEYHTNNLLNPVLFEETLKLVPSNAVLVEVAPHGLLQAILKRSLPESCTNIALTRRKHQDNGLLVLEGIGKVYLEGFHPRVDVLYPKINFPVSTGTPFLSNLIKWAHEEDWSFPEYCIGNKTFAASCNHVVSLYDKENIYLRGHSIREITVYPFAATLMLVWDTLAMTLGEPKKDQSVEFRDLRLFAQPAFHNRRQLQLSVSLCRGSGEFEVLHENMKVATGYITSLIGNNKLTKRHYDEFTTKDDAMMLSGEDIYKMLLDRDYMYSAKFRSIDKVDENLSEGAVLWEDNWVTFIDGLLQLNMLRQAHNAVSLPTHVRKLSVDVKLHMKTVSDNPGSALPASIIDTYGCTRCGGVLIEDIKFEHLLPKNYYKKMALKSLYPISNMDGLVEEKAHQPNNNLKLECTQFGDYNSFRWVDAPEVPGSGVTVTVHYAGINCNDVKMANGTPSPQVEDLKNISYGLDFSGVSDNGTRVMGIALGGAARVRAQAVPALMWPVPAYWSLEDAATVPFAYAMAFYCLSIRTVIQPRMTVYMHGACGAVGQAVISIATGIECRVFASVSEPSKKRHLLKMFPKLRSEDIGWSRDPHFHDFILQETQTRGCDIVISTARGYMKNNTLKCCANLGMVVDLMQLRDKETFVYGMYNMTKERGYATVDWSSLFKNDEEMKKIQVLIADGITQGYVRPLSRVTYPAQDVTRAFGLVAASRNRGRVLLKVKDSAASLEPRLIYKADSGHLVICDDETMTMPLVGRLIERGVKRLALQYNTSNSYIQNKIRLWKSQGIKIATFSGKINEENAISTIIDNALCFGDLAGIYFVTDGENINEDVLEKWDHVSRKMCSKLRYFAVINTGNVINGEALCRRRLESHLPFVNVQLPDVVDGASRGAALDAVERALRVRNGVWLAAPPEATPAPRLLDLLSTTAGIYLSESMNKDKTLAELGLRNDRIPLVSCFLRTEYNIVMSEDDVIPQLTIDALLKMEKSVTETPYEDIKGLSMFFNHIDSDELLSTVDMVLLPSLSQRASQIDEEFAACESFLCIVPGVEGHHERFRTLCSRLKLTALVLQPALHHAAEPMAETARRYAQILLKKTGMKKNFYLVGYESGVVVALEMAVILEAQGLTGTVFCMGYTPDGLRDSFNQALSDLHDEEQLQLAILRHMTTLLAGEHHIQGLEDALLNATTWPEKLDTYMRVLQGHIPHSSQYARALIESTLAQINKCRRYEAVPPQTPLRSKVVFLRANGSENLQLSALQQHSLQPVAVHQLTAPLAHIVWDLECAAIINSNLNPEILEEFEKDNICEKYVIKYSAKVC